MQACEFAAVLGRVEGLSILGDHTPSFEMLGLDSVYVFAAAPPEGRREAAGWPVPVPASCV